MKVGCHSFSFRSLDLCLKDVWAFGRIVLNWIALNELNKSSFFWWLMLMVNRMIFLFICNIKSNFYCFTVILSAFVLNAYHTTNYCATDKNVKEIFKVLCLTIRCGFHSWSTISDESEVWHVYLGTTSKSYEQEKLIRMKEMKLTFLRHSVGGETKIRPRPIFTSYTLSSSCGFQESFLFLMSFNLSSLFILSLSPLG